MKIRWLIGILLRETWPQTIRHVLPGRRACDGEFRFPIENAVQPVDDCELERDIRFALQGFLDNFERLSDESLPFVMLSAAKDGSRANEVWADRICRDYVGL